MQAWPGAPFPLGATFDGAGTNFSLFSGGAEGVELCLFEDGDEHRIEVTEQTALNVNGSARKSKPLHREHRTLSSGSK